MPPSPPHWVLSCKPGWSHFRSLCVLATRIISCRPVTLTILVSDVENLVDRVVAEIARCQRDEMKEIGCVGVIRIVAVSRDSTNPQSHDHSFSLVWRDLLDQRPVSCVAAGRKFEAAPRPSLTVLDGFQLSWLQIIRSLPHAPPILQWMMGFSGGFLRICGPAYLGGRGDLLRSLEGRELLSAVEPKGEIVRIPGMPPMYDWEFFPQDVAGKYEKILAAERRMSRFVEEADGILTCCAVECDAEECLSSISDWISKRNGRRTFHLGPMIPLYPGTSRFSPTVIEAEINAVNKETGTRVLDFFDRVLKNYGPQSLIYISFGTEHWPVLSHQIWTLLSVLKKKQIPFAFAYPFPGANITDEMRAEFESESRGLFMRYGPQQAILAHEACGWFLTHGGANGTMEAMSQGVPLIGWPFAVDQPVNIAHLARHHDVAFELLQVRSGAHGLQPLYGEESFPLGTSAAFEYELNRLLEAMNGEEGKRKRENAKKISVKLGDAGSRQGGRAQLALEQFLDYYLRE